MQKFLSFLLTVSVVFSGPVSFALGSEAQRKIDPIEDLLRIRQEVAEFSKYPDLSSTIKFKHRKFRKNFHLKPKYKVVNDYHFPEPQEAMSLEVDSAMVGFMHGTGGAATAMTSVASMFAFGSCILGLANIYSAVKSIGKAKSLLEETELMLKAIDQELDKISDQTHTYHHYELNQNKAFYLDLRNKIQSYLRDENQSIRINALISTGTFAEFLGFIGSESMLGHVSLFPALAHVAEYFLAGGLLVVSATSLWEAGKEAKHLWEINSLKIPGLNEEILVIPDIIRNTFLEHKDDLIPEYEDKINHMMGFEVGTPLEFECFEKYLKAEYKKAIKKRVRQHTTNSSLKFSSRFLVGAGTGVFAAHEIAAIAGVVLLPAIGLSVTGVGVGLGVALGIAGFIYYLKYIKTPPLLDIEGLHTNHFATLRMEIFSLLLKLNLTPPRENDDFIEYFRYFSKLSPIDDFSHMQGSPGQVPFIGRYEHNQDQAWVALKIIDKLRKKGLMHMTAKPVLKKFFNGKSPSEFKNWSPYITWYPDIKRGVIHWTRIALDCFQHQKTKARQLMEVLVQSGIRMELMSLQEELKMSLDQFTKMLRGKAKEKKKQRKRKV